MDEHVADDGGGLVIISIDLELDIDRPDQSGEQRLDEVRSRLIALTARHGVPATWAVADPLLSAASDQVVAAGVGHELAVLGDRTWIGYGAGRTRLARELARRFDGPRKTGIPVTTLALRNVEQVLDLDLLLDHGVTAVRGPAVDSASLARKLAPPPIRFGIWQAPIAWRIPPHAGWWISSGWRIRREIERNISRSGLLHLTIDAPRLIEAGAEGLAAIDRALHYIAAQRASGRLGTTTLGKLAARSLQGRSAVPTRSILRPAA
jgi:hypothetical protein